MRHGADAAAAPPGRLRVGGDPDLGADHRAGDVGGVAVAGLHAVVVVARRHEDDRLAVRRLDDAGGVGRDQRPPGQHAEVDGLEVGEERVVALDRHHGLPRLDPVAVVERVHGQRVPVVGAELEDRDRLVDAAEHRLVALEDLHHDARMALVAKQRLARVVEVGVGVVALPHLLDGEVEDLGREPLGLASWPVVMLRAPGRRRARPRRPRAARATAPRSRSGAAARGRASRAPSRAGGRDGVAIQAKTSTATPTAPSELAARAGPRRCAGARDGEHVAGGGRREQRADQVRAAALVLLRALLAVLVRPDRDVLGAVVGRELAAAQREQRRCERERAGEELPGGLASRSSGGRPGRRRRSRPSRRARRPLEREPRLGQRAAQLREAPRTTRRGGAGPRRNGC